MWESHAPVSCNHAAPGMYADGEDVIDVVERGNVVSAAQVFDDAEAQRRMEIAQQQREQVQQQRQ